MMSASAVDAAPTITNTLFFTDRYAANAAPGFAGFNGDYLTWNVFLTSSDPASAISVTTSRPPLGPFQMAFVGTVGSILPGYVYARGTSFDPALIAGGAWTAMATDSTGTATASFVPLLDPELLPFISGVSVSDHSLTPTISWTLPDLTDSIPTAFS
jgi:hypothetical protein